MDRPLTRFTAFEGTRRIASGPLDDVGVRAAEAAARSRDPVLVFADATGQVVDLDLRGSPEQIRARARSQAARLAGGVGTAAAASGTRRGPGRPRLGVVGREVTLLPRHWAWLSAQPGGASATLRRLVERARKQGEARDQTRRARDVAYRFMSAMAGDLPGYEEALRALFRGDRAGFRERISGWPPDVREHVATLAAEAFDEEEGAATGRAQRG